MLHFTSLVVAPSLLQACHPLLHHITWKFHGHTVPLLSTLPYTSHASVQHTASAGTSFPT